MKKVAIGCGIVVLLFAIVGIGVSWWLFRKVSTTVSEFAAMSEVPALERSVRNTTAFEPPESGELTAPQLERLTKVQAAVRQRLGARFAEMEKKYKEFMVDGRDATALDIPQLLSAYRDLASSWIDAKRAQVEALNEANFSLDEYKWVRSQAYAALGLPIMEIDVAQIVEDIKAGKTTDVGRGQLRGAVGPSGPETNRKLVEAVKKQLEDNVALASLGL